MAVPMKRFYFDKTTGSCQLFEYGGCRGNENNFADITKCQQICGEVMQNADEVSKQTKPEFAEPRIKNATRLFNQMILKN